MFSLNYSERINETKKSMTPANSELWPEDVMFRNLEDKMRWLLAFICVQGHVGGNSPKKKKKCCSDFVYFLIKKKKLKCVIIK